MAKIEISGTAAHRHGDPPEWQAAREREIVAAAQGDRMAFQRFYQHTRSRVEAFLWRRLRDPQDVAETLNDTYRQAWRFAHRYDPTRASIVGWLVALARSQAIDRFRQRTVLAQYESDFDEQAPHGLDAPELDPALTVDRAQHTSALGRALEYLTTRGRRAVKLAVVEQFTHTEVAEATGEPLGTVKSRIRRALLVVRERLHSWGIHGTH